MKLKTLTHLLTTHGNYTEKNGEYWAADGTAATVYAGIGSETLLVSFVTKFAFDSDIVLATTEKNELFALMVDDVRSVRFGKGTTKRRTGLI